LGEWEPTLESMAVSLTNSAVLVTGGSGFVGSHLLEELIKQKCRIVTTIHENDFNSYFYTQELHKKVINVPVDIRDYRRIFDIISKYQIEIIFHLAAQPLVGVAYQNPLETFSTNILGTANVLEAARISGTVKAIICASSDKAYGNLTKKRYRETDQLRGEHPYEVSKSSSDLLSLSYHTTYGLPVVITRFGNIYGEGDLHFSRLLPDIMSSLILNKKLKIRSDGKMVRDYLYVKDVVEGYIQLAKNIRKTNGNAYNFGSKETLSVQDVIELFNTILNVKIDYEILNNSKLEIPYQSLNYTKVKRTVGWSPHHTLAQTIPTIYQWYVEYFKQIKYI